MKYGLIGERLGHSFSKEVHAALADYEYELKEISPDELRAFMSVKEFTAINVTIPYKEKVIPYLDEISDEAREIGAVNTVVNRGGRLYGYNTDFFGMRSLFERLKITIEGRKVAILGSGGTAKTAKAVAKSLGASVILTVSRTEREGAISYDGLYRDHRDVDIIVNTTPVGMYPDNEGCPVDIDRFTHLSGVLDAVYNPLRTNLVLCAKEKGIPAEGGLYMLVAQAVYASEIFLGVKYPQGKTEEIYCGVLSKKENVALIGMPSSGKSTVGKILSDKLGIELLEIDELVVQNAGKNIREIFATEGEKAFRDLESDIIEHISLQNGNIISTGGGSILRYENVRRLRRNSKIVFIDRSPERLITSEDRPLSSSPEAVRALYDERYEKYLSAADLRVSGDQSPEEVAKEIIGGLRL